MTIRFIPGYEGGVINIESDEDILEALSLVVNQIKFVDSTHPILDDLEKLVNEYANYLGE